jgi:hypothetical protein
MGQGPHLAGLAGIGQSVRFASGCDSWKSHILTLFQANEAATRLHPRTGADTYCIAVLLLSVYGTGTSFGRTYVGQFAHFALFLM